MSSILRGKYSSLHIQELQNKAWTPDIYLLYTWLPFITKLKNLKSLESPDQPLGQFLVSLGSNLTLKVLHSWKLTAVRCSTPTECLKVNKKIILFLFYFVQLKWFVSCQWILAYLPLTLYLYDPTLVYTNKLLSNIMALY